MFVWNIRKIKDIKKRFLRFDRFIKIYWKIVSGMKVNKKKEIILFYFIFIF